MSVFRELKQKKKKKPTARKLEKDNMVSQRIFTLWGDGSKRKEASGIEFGSDTSYTETTFSVEKLFCCVEVGMG